MFRFPREGGDPDPFAQAVSDPLDPCFRGERGGEGVVAYPPLPTLSPSRGERALYNRVIASAAKQPRGLTRTSVDVPLGCFGAMRLAMMRGRVDQNPIPLLRGYFPHRGKIYRPSSSPSGGSGAKRRRGPCFFTAPKAQRQPSPFHRSPPLPSSGLRQCRAFPGP